MSPRSFFMGHVAQFPGRVLAEYGIDLVNHAASVIADYIAVEVVRLGNRIGTIVTIGIPDFGHYRAMLPGDDMLFEKRHIKDGEMKTLCVVKKLLQLQMRDQLTTFFVRKAEDVPGRIVGGCHGVLQIAQSCAATSLCVAVALSYKGYVTTLSSEKCSSARFGEHLYCGKSAPCSLSIYLFLNIPYPPTS